MTSPGIFTLRTYAIYGRSKVVLFLLAVPVFVELSSSIWETVAQTAVALPPELQFGPLTCGFNGASSLDTGFVSIFIHGDVADFFAHQSATVVNFASGAVFDALVVILTVSRTGRLGLQSRKVNIIGSLSFILARDGMLYYSAIFVPQLVLVALNVAVLKTGSDSLDDVSGALSSISDALQVILVNRLVLSLSKAANPREDSEFRTRTGLEPPTFAAGPVLGNIGGSLRTLPDDLDDEILNVVEIADADEVQGETTEPASANGAGELNGIIEFRHDTGIADV